MRLLEREAELRAIDRALSDARAGAGSLLIVEGAPGVGKSSLLAEAAEAAAATDIAVLRAVGDELEGDFAFGIALQLFEPVLARLPDDERDVLLAGAAELAAPLLVRGRRASLPAGEEHGFALTHGLHWLVSNMAERRPLLIAVDDAHWADRPSLRFIAYLAQRLEDLAVAVVVALRPGDAPSREDLITQLTGHRLAQVVRLPTLNASSVSELVRDRLPGAEPSFCASCREVTEGNPFLLRELLAALDEEGLAPTDANAESVARLAPSSVLRAVLARLARLPSASAGLARAVAALGGDATLEAAAALADVPIEEAAYAADALVAADIFRSGSGAGFVHPLIRSAIYADIPDGERGLMHGRAARLLDARGAADQIVGGHLVLATPSGDAWTVDRLRSAAAEATVAGAPGSAVSYLRRALAEPPVADVRPEVLIELGRAELAAGESDADERFRAAARLLSDPQERAQAHAELGRALNSYGRLGEAAAAFDEGLAELGESSSELRNELEAASLLLAHLSLRSRADERVREVVARTDTPRSRSECMLLMMIAYQRGVAGDPRVETIDLIHRALDGVDRPAREADAPVWESALAMLGWADDLDRYADEVEGLLEVARLRGSVTAFATVSLSRSLLNYHRGRLYEAIADAQQAIGARRYGWEQFLPVAGACLAWALMERGDLDGAADALDQCGPEARWEQTSMHRWLLEPRGRLLLATGDPHGALELLTRAGEVARHAGMVNPAILPWRAHAALAAHQAGDHDLARSVAAEDVELSRRFGAPRALGMALRSAGLVDGGASGIALLRESVEVLECSPSQLELARSLVDYGAALRREGHRTESREPLRRGIEMAHRFRASALERRGNDELGASGARPRRTALKGVPSLTPSELRVAEMAADGMTNREIAQALFVTVKAVQWHLGNTYRKLEVSSRDDLRPALRPVAQFEDPGSG